MNFNDTAQSLTQKSRAEVAFEKICKNLPATHIKISNILGIDLTDKESVLGKKRRQDFGDLMNEMVAKGFVKEIKGKYHNAESIDSLIDRTIATDTKQPTITIPQELMGVVHVFNDKALFEPLDGDLPTIPIESMLEVLDGNILTVRLSDDFKSVSKIIETHGNMEDDNAFGKISALSIGIPLKFPDDVLYDTPSLAIPPISPHRKDFRHIPFITIDPITAKDFDDAICVRRTPKGWKAMVAIADVSHYIKPGTKLADEAYKRGNSTYLPDMVIPMLPEELSNGVCSLKPNEDRACVVCTMDIDKMGNITSYKFERGLMRSRMRLNYEQVQAAIMGDRKQLPRNGWGYIEKALEVCNARLKDKKRRGALTINAAEQSISIGRSRDIGLALEVGNESHNIIEELMIAANVCAAADTTIKRIHGTPKEEVFNSYSDELRDLGIKVPKTGDLKEKILRVIDQIPACDDPDLAYSFVTRMQDMASYSTEQLEHFGLGLEKYTHWTSPIRRGTDWYIHSEINEKTRLVGGYHLSPEMKAGMAKAAEHFSRTERRSEAAERECNRRYMALWVKRNIENEFRGQITFVNGKHLWVKVENDGLSIRTAIKASDLPNPLHSYRPGDMITMSPKKANVVTGIIEFSGIATPHP